MMKPDDPQCSSGRENMNLRGGWCKTTFYPMWFLMHSKQITLKKQKYTDAMVVVVCKTLASSLITAL